MSLFKVIDGLFVGLRYGVLCLSILGIFASIVLFFLNISMGMAALMVFVATLALSVSLTLFLVPEAFIKKNISNKKRYATGATLVIVAAIVMGITYFTASGFPELNLLFM